LRDESLFDFNPARFHRFDLNLTSSLTLSRPTRVTHPA
jgi:hypothetical protein